VSSESESEDALDHILSNIWSAYSRGLRETGRNGYMREIKYAPLIVSIPMSPTLLDSGLDLLLNVREGGDGFLRRRTGRVERNGLVIS
jgi:hypothetical protein